MLTHPAAEAAPLPRWDLKPVPLVRRNESATSHPPLHPDESGHKERGGDSDLFLKYLTPIKDDIYDFR